MCGKKLLKRTLQPSHIVDNADEYVVEEYFLADGIHSGVSTVSSKIAFCHWMNHAVAESKASKNTISEKDVTVW